MNWSIFWTAFASITSLGLLVITGIYAWLTRRMVQAVERQSWELARPRMEVSLRTNQGGQLLLLHIENLGPLPAENLRLAIDKPVHQTHGSKSALNDAPAFRNAVRALPSRRPIRYPLGVYFNFFKDDADRLLHSLSFVVTAEYQSGSQSFRDAFPIDILEQEGATSIERNYLAEFGQRFPDKFERSMRDIQKALEDIGEPTAKSAIKRRSWGEWFVPATTE